MKPITNPESWQFEIKNLQTAGYDDSLRFSASLYFDGKRIAIASNDGNGGDHRLQFFESEHRQLFEQYVDHFDTVALRPTKNWMHFSLQYSLADLSSNDIRTWTQDDIDRDMVLDSLCKAAEWRKKLKLKRYAKNTVFADLSTMKLYVADIEYGPTVEPIRQELAQLVPTDAENIVIFNELILAPKSPQESK